MKRLITMVAVAMAGTFAAEMAIHALGFGTVPQLTPANGEDWTGATDRCWSLVRQRRSMACVL